MKRLVLVLAMIPVLAGWIFLRRPAGTSAECTCELLGGRCTVSVRFSDLSAVEAADREASSLSADGWQAAPVCTPTFRLMTRGGAVAALLAENAEGRTRVTLLQSRDDL
ncbi:MAG: hypothetical protein IKO72_14280 [Kiritimatiellae bacterium]|nr:hypothetical protein [Kiritimatiellia bacterium]